MPWRDFWCAGSLPSLWKSKPGKSVCWQGISHRLLVKLLRQSAELTPRRLVALRLACDLPVPQVLLRQDVTVLSDTLRLPASEKASEVSIQLEWLVPQSAPGSRKRSASFKWLPGFGCTDVGGRCPRDFKRVVLYLHGGAYVLCTAKSLRGITFNVAAALQAALCAPDFRRPPEHPIPGPMEDAIAVYRHLLETMPGTDIILAGDSAGGGIAAAMMHKLQELELPPPTCCILISPWTDLGHDGMRNATLSNEDCDFLPPDLVEFCASMTRGDLPHNDWQHSPVFAPAPLDKIPPVLVVYGEDELLAGQIAHFGSVWRQKGASVTLVPVRGGVHAPLLLHHVWEPAVDAFRDLSRYGLLSYAKSVTKPKHIPTHSMVPSLPGGALVWGFLPMATMAFWAVTLYSHGPRRDPTMQSTEDVNSALSRLLPELNRQIHSDIKDSAGDCEALWDYRTTIGEVLFSSPLSEIYRSCEGSGRLAHITTDRGGVDTDIAVLWATGLKSLELVDALVTPPADISAPSQQWALTLTAMFSNLHIYTKVLVNDKEWLSDYICCDKTLHFTVKASAECHTGIGFSAIQLELVNMDKIDFVQKKQMVLDSGAHASFELDYGTSETVEKAVANFISLKAGALLMRNSDGSTTDTLQTVSEALSAVIELNTGQRCLTHV
eukprot:s207_g2.t1